MRSQRSTEIKVGLVSFLAIALFIVGMSLGKGWTVSRTFDINFVFPNSAGILPGAPVVVNGVKRGTVSSVENQNGYVYIKAAVNNFDDFREDVSAKITILELTGGKKIEIHPGTADEKYIAGTVIYGTTPPDISELITILGAVSHDGVTLVRRLDTLTAAINDMFVSEDIYNKLSKTISNVESLTGSLNIMLDDNYANIDRTFKDLSVITSDLKDAIKKYEPNVDQLLQKLDLAIEQAQTTMRNADLALQSADSLIYDVRSLSADIKNGDGMVSRLIYDKELAASLDSSLTDLKIFLGQVRSHGINVNVRLGTRP